MEYVWRMDCARLSKKVMFGSLVKPADIPWGNKRGRPKKDWASCLKDDCERVGLNPFMPAHNLNVIRAFASIKLLIYLEFDNLLQITRSRQILTNYQ